MNPGEAMEMKKAVDAAGVTFMMGFVNRFRGESIAVMEAVESGLLGNVYYAKSSLLRRRGTPLGWFTDLSKSGGGPVIDIGVHMLDLTWYLMGRPEPISVNACVHHVLGDYKTKGVSRWEAFDTDNLVFETEDSADGLIRFKNGASILFDVSWAINCGVSDEMSVNLYGSKAGATVYPAMLYGEAAGYLSDTALKTSKLQPFSGEIGHFLDCVRTGRKPIAPIEDGIVIQRILNGIYDSAAAGKEVMV
jgi:predicted dehydrogenase